MAEDPPFRPSHVRVGLVVLLAIVLGGARTWVVATQQLTTEQFRLWDFVLAGVFVAVSLLVLTTRGLAEIVGVLGAATAAVAGLQLVSPLVPQVQEAGACKGAVVANVPFLATSSPIGVNAREGPGRSYEQKGRYGGNCTLGFVGFCYGEPAADEFLASVGFDVLETRWFKLPKGRGFISGAVVKGQRPERNLPHLEDCKSEPPRPSDLFLVGPPTYPFSGRVPLRAGARNAFTGGFAAVAVTKDQSDAVMTRIALDTYASDGFAAPSWDTASQPTAGGGVGKGSVLVVAVVCDAAETPSDIVDGEVVELDNPTREPPARGAVAMSYEDLEKEKPALAARLRRTACLLPSGAGAGEPAESGATDE